MIKVNFWLLTGIMLVNLVLIMESLCPNSEQATFDADLASEASRGAFPLLSHHFKENKGQITNPAARFYFSQADYGIAFTETGLIFKLSSHMQRNVCVNRALDPLFERTKGLELEKPSSSIKSGIGITLHFEGARRVRPIGQQMYQHLSNYFLGADPNHWVTGVRSFNQIVYPELYEGIDLIYYFTVDGLRYDFVVKPGGDPQAIKLRYEGIDQLSIDKTGALIAQTPLRSLIDQDLFIYQDTPKGRHEIRGAFTLYDDTTFGFHLFDSFFSEFPLVFDPLIWSTILGDEYSDRGYSIALDASNNVYVTGYTNSANFPTTSGAYNETHNGDFDAFVCKLSADGSSLDYSTFLGGNDTDVGMGIALDASNNAYITGHTFSRNFPTTSGAYDETYNNYSDVFVCKLSADGSSLGYSTFLGGSLHDYGMGIALDASNNAYITGYTNSTDFPTTLNAYNATGDGDYQLWDVFVFKLAANGITLLYSTYVSGSDDDYSQDITLDASNNVYVTGYTNSANFPTTSGAYNETHTKHYDAFVCKLSADGSSLGYSTFLGGNDNDVGKGIALDASNNAYITGHTFSRNFPTTSGAYDETLTILLYGIQADVFICKLSADGSILDYSTYIGGVMSDYGMDIALDASNNAYVTGYTYEPQGPVVRFPTTPGAFDEELNGGSDIFVCQLELTAEARRGDSFPPVVLLASLLMLVTLKKKYSKKTKTKKA